MRCDPFLLKSILHSCVHPHFVSLDFALQHAKKVTNKRCFNAISCKRDIRPLQDLPRRIIPRYHERKVGSEETDLFSLHWPAPPRNILLVKKECAPAPTKSLKELVNHLHNAYPSTNVLLEPRTASEIHGDLPCPIYSSTLGVWSHRDLHELHAKVDLAVTLGGDGTILHASSLFASSQDVPPMLSFSMGTLGFLSEWKFTEYKRAFREVYMSGADPDGRDGALDDSSRSPAVAGSGSGPTGWSSIRGKSMGSSRAAKVLMRHRLKVGVFAADGKPLGSAGTVTAFPTYLRAMNEVIIHRGRDPHLAVVEVFVGGRFLTEAVADGMIVATPTGSTAYSLSSGGSIIHPLVPSILLTPICPRSLSFRPLVLPVTTPITLKLGDKNRGREVEVSIDGVRRREAMGVGMEVRVTGEEIKQTESGGYSGVPSIMRRACVPGEGDGGWVGGLNGLLKFNYPFGEDS